MDCFLKPNWRGLWPGRVPSRGCRNHSRPGLENQVASLRLWAVPWPKMGSYSPMCYPPGLLLKPQLMSHLRKRLYSGNLLLLHTEGQAGLPFGPCWGPGDAVLRSRLPGWTCLPHSPRVFKMNNKPFQRWDVPRLFDNLSVTGANGGRP